MHVSLFLIRHITALSNAVERFFFPSCAVGYHQASLAHTFQPHSLHHLSNIISLVFLTGSLGLSCHYLAQKNLQFVLVDSVTASVGDNVSATKTPITAPARKNICERQQFITSPPHVQPLRPWRAWQKRPSAVLSSCVASWSSFACLCAIGAGAQRILKGDLFSKYESHLGSSMSAVCPRKHLGAALPRSLLRHGGPRTATRPGIGCVTTVNPQLQISLCSPGR